jgi:hypothetical protein
MERQRGIHAIKTHLGNLHCFHAYCGDTVFQSGWSIVKLVHFDFFFLKSCFTRFILKEMKSWYTIETQELLSIQD